MKFSKIQTERALRNRMPSERVAWVDSVQHSLRQVQTPDESPMLEARKMRRAIGNGDRDHHSQGQHL